MQARGLAAAAIASLVGAGFSAQALSPPPPAVVSPPAPQGYEAEDHFPGSAYYTAVEDNAATVTGVTGTVELPEAPVPENAVVAVDTSIQPAQPFRLAGSDLDKSRALQCLTTAIYYEAANEPDDGQRAVAQVILNRVRHPTFPHTVCGVVFQGSERKGCQFSFACDGAMARIPARSAWLRSQKVAAAALAGSVFSAVGMATHYHTYAVTPSWNKSLVMTGVFGAHFFHRWKGYWGTASAFTARYAGHEPLPAPHQSIEPVAPVAVAAAAPARLSPVTAREAIQPAYADSGAPKPGYVPPVKAAAAAPVTDDSQILDKWKDSGKPLR